MSTPTLLSTLLQIDTKISLGNILAIGATIFTIGGAWYALTEALKTTNTRLEEISKELTIIKVEYLRKDIDVLNEKIVAERIEEIMRRIVILEGSPPKSRTSRAK